MPHSRAPPVSPRSPSARARPTVTAWTAAAIARSTRPSTASPSPACAATPRPRTTSPANAPKARPPRRRSAASSATSPADSGTCSSRPRPDQGLPPQQFLDIGAAKAQLDESLHEVECRLCLLAPAAVDRERVPAVRDPGDLGDGLVVLLALVSGLGDRPRDGVVLLALDDQQRATGWI